MSASDWAAWWGAGVATLVLIWDLFKWATSGARLHVRAVTGMQQYIEGVGVDPTSHVFVEVMNRGDRSTTITHLALYAYPSRLARFFRRRPSSLGFVPKPSGPLPAELAAGQRWTGVVEQDQAKKIAKGNLLWIGVVHTDSNTPALVRVQL